MAGEGSGPRPVPDLLCLQGILLVLHTGIGWEDLPQELGFGSGMTCWRRLQRWTEAGVFDQVHQILLAKLNATNRIDWSRATMGDSHIDAKRDAGTGPSPVNRDKPGSKHHLICDGNGTPIYVLTNGANVPDIKRALDLPDCYPPIAAAPADHDAASLPGYKSMDAAFIALREHNARLAPWVFRIRDFDLILI